MKKGEFDLTRKAIDCSELPVLGNAGKEIFRALKVACNGVNNGRSGQLGVVLSNAAHYRYLFLDEHGEYFISFAGSKTVIQPSDVLGQAAIDAAMDGATIMFEGDELPDKNKVVYYDNGHVSSSFSSGGTATNNVIAYKLLEEQPNDPQKKYGESLTESVFKNLQSVVEYRILSEKVGFKELCPICSSQDWVERETEAYDDLRDTHIETVRENLELIKQVEGLECEVKRLQRKINDARCDLDD